VAISWPKLSVWGPGGLGASLACSGLLLDPQGPIQLLVRHEPATQYLLALTPTPRNCNPSNRCSPLMGRFPPPSTSFKHTVQLWVHWHRIGQDCDEQRPTMLLILIAQQQVGNRPGRIEPRAVKRRNKPYPLLTKPRSDARAEVQKHGHPKEPK